MLNVGNKKVVIVDDDIDMADFVSDATELLGFDPIVVSDGKACLQQVSEHAPACIIMDIVMPDMDGVELLGKLAETESKSPVIMMSGFDGKYLESVSLIAEANGLKVLGSLMKPFSVDNLEPLLSSLEAGGGQEEGSGL